jgi:hydroxypyruvate reductase
MDRQDVIAAFRYALAAVDAEATTAQACSYQRASLTIGGTSVGGVAPGDIVVVGIGKAAPGMVRGVCAATGASRGVVVSDHDEPCPVPLLVGDHPVPGPASFLAGDALAREVAAMAPSDVLVACVSGGGSALAEIPTSGVERSDIVAMNEALLRSGLPIAEVNALRASVSALKAGRLVERTEVRAGWTILIDDVVDGGAHLVASGPTLTSDLGSGASAIIDRGGLSGTLPPSVIEAARAWEPAAPPRMEMASTIVASPTTTALAVLAHLGDDRAELMTSSLDGNTVDAVHSMVVHRPDRVVVASGETTVHVTSDAPGGRNQHAALIAARAIEGTDRVFGALATDGRDGTTNAAGAIVNGTTIARIRSLGIDPDRAIADFMAHQALDAVGDTVVTGPTGTNVADVWICS